MKRFFFLGIVLVFILVAAGELARLSIGPINGVLPNDLLIGILGLVWLSQKIFIERKWTKSILWAPFFVFITIAGISLINGSKELTTKETLLSSFYLVRFIEYFLLAFIVHDLAQDKIYRKNIFKVIVGSALLIAILGFLQLKFFPDFTEFQEAGWDPHINRLLSTWFDPNFVGGMFALVLSLILGKLSVEGKLKKNSWLIIAGTILLIALFVTYSRSAYLTFMAAVGIIGLLKSRKILIGALIASLLLISVSDRALDRVTDMIHSAQSLITTSAELPDATARLRIESWENAIIIIKDHPWLGVGYNTYSYVQTNYGFVKDLEEHSSTGSDSTILTILATTGFIGLAAYLWLIGAMLWLGFWGRKNALCLGFLGGLCGLLIHSIFVNGLLYTPILIFFYSALGLILPPLKSSIKINK